jgi:dipeptidase E
MVVLTSNGLTSNKLIKEIKQYMKNLQKAVIITTASFPYKENDKHIPRITNELKHLGLSVDYFDFDTDDPELLLQYDVIEINGGNPFYLLAAIKKATAETLIKRISKEKLLIGISAGSIIMQKDMNLIAEFTPEMNDTVNLPDFSALGIVDVQIIPHYHRFTNRFDSFEQRIKKYELDNNCSVLRMDDGDGLFVEV